MTQPIGNNKMRHGRSLLILPPAMTRRALLLGLMFLGAIGPSMAQPVAPKPEDPRLTVDIRTNGVQFYIGNDDKFDWTDCVVKINYRGSGSGYELKIRKIAAGMARTVAVNEFANSDGERFDPITHKAQTVFIICQTPVGSRAAGVDTD